MSSLLKLKHIKQRFLTNSTSLTEQDLELWVHLYALAKQQQQFAHALYPSLAQLNSPLLTQAEQIKLQDTLLRRTKGTLLKQLDQISDPHTQRYLLSLLAD
ncbi:hypothetical protein BMT54_06335 [Pasteurellaceae bacterium 15-036681]|nr:hypothetical protein BMT54_06335 [Pasteurellaceae bacterium 15-036681]